LQNLSLVYGTLGLDHDMALTSLQAKVRGLLAQADVRINGNRPWDLQVRNPDWYRRVLVGGSLGLGESYMDGWWECDRLDEFFFRILQAELDGQIQPLVVLWDWLKARVVNLQRISRAFQVGRRHYDIGNDLFRAMLGERLVYSCAYWNGATTLDEAQEAKLALIGQKLHLAPGMKVLDIGCGWGGTARFLAEKFGVQVVGISVSQEQVAIAQEMCRGLPVKVCLQDYRDIEGMYDRVVSVGMFEHVGCKNYRTFMRVIRDHLKEDGLLLLHTIGNNRSVASTDPWIVRYIFPNSMLPSPRQIATAMEGLFVLEDWHNIGVNYDRTLMTWFDNFQRSWPDLQGKYGERFYRMWKYYLLSCAGGFRARQMQVWQIVLSPRGVSGGYRLSPL
jgi:cyclopropane-fatty-acyl-phospholipid synthase